MSSEVVTPEIDVLVAVAVWLWRRKVLPYQFSIARGKGIDMTVAKSKLNTALDREGIPGEWRTFVGQGPDVIAISGASTGRSSVREPVAESDPPSGITLIVAFQVLFPITLNLHQTLVARLSIMRVQS